MRFMGRMSPGPSTNFRTCIGDRPLRVGNRWGARIHGTREATHRREPPTDVGFDAESASLASILAGCRATPGGVFPPKSTTPRQPAIPGYGSIRATRAGVRAGRTRVRARPRGSRSRRAGRATRPGANPVPCASARAHRVRNPVFAVRNSESPTRRSLRGGRFASAALRALTSPRTPDYARWDAPPGRPFACLTLRASTKASFDRAPPAAGPPHATVRRATRSLPPCVSPARWPS